MFFLNLMPTALRNASRAFYLRRQLEQLNLNEAHFMRTIKGYEIELAKVQAERAVVTRELRGISA